MENQMFILTDNDHTESFGTLQQAIDGAHARLELPGPHVGGIAYDGPDDSFDANLAEFRSHDAQPAGTFAPAVEAGYHLAMLDVDLKVYFMKGTA